MNLTIYGARLGSSQDAEAPKVQGHCWLYAGYIADNGYGQIRQKIDGKNCAHLAHRVSYEATVGKIPDGLQLDHLCRVRRCINPAHLEPVTPRENQLRGFGVSGLAARRTHCPKGHEYDEVRPDGNNRTMRVCRTCRLAANYRYKAKVKAKADNLSAERRGE